MMEGLIGRKLGMTRLFEEDGRAVPVTVIEAGPCRVGQVKTRAEGRAAVQLGFGARKATRTSKALAGHVKAAGTELAPAVLRDFPLIASEVPSPGDVVTVNIFERGDRVKVIGTTKGRGFQGVVKRYGFRGGGASHGSTRYRRTGSLGPGNDPSRVIKGKKMPGQMGAARRTQLGLSVVRVDAERNLLYVRGAVPGPVRGIVLVKRHKGKRSRYA
jgi:large subunit ribosomal protein L3